MKPIYKIAKTELKTLFFSPIAWLIIVIFTFQAAFLFTDVFEGMVKAQVLGYKLPAATIKTFSGFIGLFTKVQAYLYLYIPLLTMGVMSREFSSGSIKLLYSSPLTSKQIILGKYLALVIYSLVLTGILAIFGLYAALTIKHVELPVILTGLLGIFLLTCSYASVGLFMSSLTSYTVVSAMGTLAIFAMLSYIKGIGQDIEFVRDITYWLAISGRSDTFISGMITSEDVLYFIIVISLFLGFTIIRIQNSRQRTPWIVNTGLYVVVFLSAMLMGYFSTKPKLMAYYDATRTKMNTLTKSSQAVLDHMHDDITITTYTNLLEENAWQALPRSYKYDVDRFKQYIRFKPGTKMKYVYYYHKTENQELARSYPKLGEQQLIDTLIKMNDWNFPIVPYSTVKKEIDLAPENYRFVRSLQLPNGKQTFLRVYNDMRRHPSEAEISAAFKRLVMDSLPVVGFLTGHGERRSNAEDNRGYRMFAREKTFRYALINQGFDFQDVTLEKEIPSNIRILIIAEARKEMTSEEMTHLNSYIAKGGNLIIAGEPGRQQFMNPITAPLGVQFMPGILVKPTLKFQPDLMLMAPTKDAANFSYHLDMAKKLEQVLPLVTTTGLTYTTDKGFKVITLFSSDSIGSWNELETTNLIDDTVRLNTAVGEVERSYPTVLALSRKLGNRDQRIIVTGDADWLSNEELTGSRRNVRSANFALISAAFYWLTNEELPIDMRRDRTTDDAVRVGKAGWSVASIMLKWIFPLLLMAAGLIIWLRRKGR